MDTPYYKDIVIKAIFEQEEVKSADPETETPAEYRVVINTPFKRYSEQVFIDGVDVTYSYCNNLDLVGKECIVFTSVIDQHPILPSEVAKAKSDLKTLSGDWKDISKDDAIIKNYKVDKKPDNFSCLDTSNISIIEEEL